MRPTVVITGSGLPDREYRPPLKNAEGIPTACLELGRELARSECDLVVFSSSGDYIERDVVSGYLSALNGSRRGKVVVRTPHDRTVDFGVPEHLAHVIEVKPDPAADWEVSYYRALLEADGLIVIGGGRTARIAGVLALTQRIPVIAMATFGAGALTVWQHLDRQRNDASDDDIHAMASEWTQESAARLTASLLGQLSRRREIIRASERETARRGRSRMAHGLVAVGTIVLAAMSVWLGYSTQSTSAAVAYLLAGPLLSATAGALLQDTSTGEPNTVWSAARGLGAGVLAAMLYVGSQQLTNAEHLTPDSARRLAWFLIPLGFAAGYTVDGVFARLNRVDALSDKPFRST
ncbi:hypothetical protein ACFV23_18030 [Streptomyces sp. NPDC059627]